MASLNKATLIGRLGQDPEVKPIPTSNTTVTKFTIATSDGPSKDPKKPEITQWHRIVAWGKLAETCGTYLKKGSLVHLEGKITTRSYEKDGQKKETTEIVASNVIFLDSKPKSNAKSDEDYKNLYTDDIPF